MTLTSYNGWPASKEQVEIGIKSYAVPGTLIKLRCAEKVAPLLIGFADTGLTATITPTSASNKVLVFVSQNGVAKTASNASSGVGIKLMRASTDILTLSNQAGYTANAAANNVGAVSCEFLDSPATTSATIYKTQFKNNIGASAAVVQEYFISSTIVLMEVTP